MNTLGVIIARSGSVGLKDKHLRQLLGRELIQYSFEHAKSSRRLTRTVVSSDSAQVRRLAEKSFLETISRPQELSTSDASVQSVLLHALDTVEQRSNFKADAMALVYGNVPVRPAGVIDRAIELLHQTGCDSVRSFCPVGKWHPAWMCKVNGDRVQQLHPGSIHRRQDLEPLYFHDGAIVVVSRNSLLTAREKPDDPHAFFGADRRAILTEMGEAIEVDHLRDLYWAEAVLTDRLASRSGARKAS